MVIEEKCLIRAMMAAYKRTGYKVAVEAPAGILQVMIADPGWMVVCEKEHLPRKVLGKLVEHLGTIPDTGEAYQVAKKQTQTEIFDVAMSGLTSIRENQHQKQKISRTALTLNGNTLWQSHEDKHLVMITPEEEEILNTRGRTVLLISGETLVVYGAVSWGYIDVVDDSWDEFEDMLAHLSKMEWICI